MDRTAQALDRSAELIDAHSDYRVTRTLPPLVQLPLPTPVGRVRTALVVDNETTSLDWRSGKIIQIAVCPIDFDERAWIVAIGSTRSWLEDSGEPLTDEIVCLTGLTDAEFAGERIDDADVLVALLTTTLPDGRTACDELRQTASPSVVRITALGIPFAAEDVLRERGSGAGCRSIAFSRSSYLKGGAMLNATGSSLRATARHRRPIR